jgi:hypothetical protein
MHGLPAHSTTHVQCCLTSASPTLTVLRLRQPPAGEPPSTFDRGGETHHEPIMGTRPPAPRRPATPLTPRQRARKGRMGKAGMGKAQCAEPVCPSGKDRYVAVAPFGPFTAGSCSSMRT